MSEIPLHSLGRARKSRAGYAPLHNGEPNTHSEQEGTDMPMTARVAASSARRKGKRRERYDSDYAEESATLLGDDLAEGEFRDDEAEEGRNTLEQETPSQVCCMLCFLPRYRLNT